MRKNIAVLFCFMIFPVLQTSLFKSLSSLSGFFDDIRSVFDDRAYALPKTSNNQTKVTLYAPNMHIGHELSVIGSIEFQNWHVTQNNEAGATPSEKISPIRVSTISPGLFLRYAYQFPITTNFGFFLGTTAGVVFTERGKTQFQGGYSVFFPTIMGGFWGTPTQNDRLLIGAEYSGVWYPEMVIYTNEGLSKPLAATLSAWNFYLENDYFLSDNSAISVTGGARLINNICKLSFVCSSANYLYTLRIENWTYYAQIGAVFSL